MPKERNYIKIEFSYSLYGINHYRAFDEQNNVVAMGTYHSGDCFWYCNGLPQKTYITKETQALFEEAHQRFITELDKAKKAEDGYITTQIIDYLFAYKKISELEEYIFVLSSDNFTRIFQNTIPDFIHALYHGAIYYRGRGYPIGRDRETVDAIKREIEKKIEELP